MRVSTSNWRRREKSVPIGYSGQTLRELRKMVLLLKLKSGRVRDRC